MSQLSVLTFNIWGLWLVSKRREERVRYAWSAQSICYRVLPIAYAVAYPVHTASAVVFARL